MTKIKTRSLFMRQRQALETLAGQDPAAYQLDAQTGVLSFPLSRISEVAAAAGITDFSVFDITEDIAEVDYCYCSERNRFNLDALTEEGHNFSGFLPDTLVAEVLVNSGFVDSYDPQTNVLTYERPPMTNDPEADMVKTFANLSDFIEDRKGDVWQAMVSFYLIAFADDLSESESKPRTTNQLIQIQKAKAA